ncbi:MAG TPA: class I SAM-dependent methyltransferase [Acidimicrobiales bacterium]|nr:class I SAM-dependent methyltransferase [Acidimicrobiales bacterium]
MPTADEIRTAQRATWARLSAGWEKWDAVIMDQMAPVSAAIVNGLAVSDGQRVLDIASGTGEPGLTIAAANPKATVILTDLSAEMLAVAQRRADAGGIANIATQVCSADDLPFADESFDAVSVRFGYMFFPDMARATAEFVRVLRPGGRLAASVWVNAADNPWTSILMQAIGAEVELSPPDPNGPNMYRCAGDGFVSALFRDAGLQDVAETDVAVDLVTRSADEYWDVMSEHVSLAVAALAEADDATRARMRANAIAAVAPYARDGAVHVPGAARCIVGTK